MQFCVCWLQVVMDVGCGTGILSLLCAKHGARKVSLPSTELGQIKALNSCWISKRAVSSWIGVRCWSKRDSRVRQQVGPAEPALGQSGGRLEQGRASAVDGESGPHHLRVDGDITTGTCVLYMHTRVPLSLAAPLFCWCLVAWQKLKCHSHVHDYLCVTLL